MDYYNDLHTRALNKGLKTFGDILNKVGIDGEDLWPGEYDPEMMGDDLYWCDAATAALEILAEGQLI